MKTNKFVKVIKTETTQLVDLIKQTDTSDQLRIVIKSIKKQENGHPTTMASHLQDAFWYHDLQRDFQKQKNWVLKIIYSYD